MAAPAPHFTARLLGQTEKAASALLQRVLARPGLSEPEWVTLVIAGDHDRALTGQELSERVARATSFSTERSYESIKRLAEKGMLALPGDDGRLVGLSALGRSTLDEVRGHTGTIAARLWGDLPAEDLATTARVLNAILGRARTLLQEGS